MRAIHFENHLFHLTMKNFFAIDMVNRKWCLRFREYFRVVAESRQLISLNWDERKCKLLVMYKLTLNHAISLISRSARNTIRSVQMNVYEKTMRFGHEFLATTNIHVVRLVGTRGTKIFAHCASGWNKVYVLINGEIKNARRFSITTTSSDASFFFSSRVILITLRWSVY